MNIFKFAAFTNYLGSTTGREFTVQEIEILHDQINGMLEPNKVAVLELENLMDAMKNSRKIDAIKAYRTLTGASLVDAKNAIERHYVSKQPEAV